MKCMSLISLKDLKFVLQQTVQNKNPPSLLPPPLSLFCLQFLPEPAQGNGPALCNTRTLPVLVKSFYFKKTQM